MQTQTLPQTPATNKPPKAFYCHVYDMPGILAKVDGQIVFFDPETGRVEPFEVEMAPFTCVLGDIGLVETQRLMDTMQTDSSCWRVAARTNTHPGGRRRRPQGDPMTTQDIIDAVNAYADACKAEGNTIGWLTLVSRSNRSPEADRARAVREAGREALDAVQDWPTEQTLNDGACLLRAPEGQLVRAWRERRDGQTFERLTREAPTP
jgi:hypothetical protein